MSSSFVLLVSDTLKRHLASVSRRELERLREKFDYLASGLWDGGLRVKKLKGSGAVVFEARVSKGDRLLFTLGREDGVARIYAWGIESHDDVNRAKTAILPGDAPFLSFEGIEEREEKDLDLGSLDPDWYTQEAFEAVAAEDCGPQRWRVVEEGDWERLLAQAEGAEVDLRLHLTEAQRLALSGEPPLLLSGTAGSGKTTIAIYYLLRNLPGVERRLFLTWHPFLAEHSRRLYESLARGRKAAPAIPPRFAPWRDLVRELVVARGEGAASRFDPAREADLAWFGSSLRDRKEFGDLDPELAWEEIRGIIKGARPSLNLNRLGSHLEALEGGRLSTLARGELCELLEAMEFLGFLPKVEAFLERRGGYPSLGAFAGDFASPSFASRDVAISLFGMVLEQLDKRRAALGRSILPFEEYQALGAKRAPRFASSRHSIYAAAEWYESALRDKGLWDDIDLARAAIDAIEDRGAGTAKEFSPWDLVVCDEAQDFANVHFQLVFRLAADPSRLVLAGDVKQTINPSGFRWADLRSLFWERGIKPPELFRLDLNFRSVGGIVAIGNALLDLKKRLAGIESDEHKERWKFAGLLPCLLGGANEGSVVGSMPKAGAANAVIVRDAATKERVRAMAKSEFVFTIAESKGLEFDATLLWNLTPSEGELSVLWRRLVSDDKAALGREARIVHEINLYYVAVTRARNGLVIYEANKDFWNQEEFSGLFVPSAEAGVIETYWTRVSSPAEWRERGDYYAERGHWLAAAECYRNAGDEAAEARAMGRGLLAAGRHEDAAPWLEAAGLRKEAAGAWEVAGNMERAGALWLELGDTKRAARCRALGFEKKGVMLEAARLWLELKDKKAAARCLSRAETDPKAAELYVALKLWPKAGECLSRAGRHAEAAECFRKAKLHGRAAAAYEAAGDLVAAHRSYALAHDYKKEVDCLMRLGRFDVLAQRRLAARDLDGASSFYSRWVAIDAAARVPALIAEAEALLAKKPGEAGVRFSAAKDFGRAVEAYGRAREWELAAEAAVDAGDHLGASDFLAKKGLYARAAKEREVAGLHDATTVALLRESLYMASSRKPDRKAVEALNAEAESFEAMGEIDRALNRYIVIGHVKAAIPLFMKGDRDEEAFEFLSNYNKFEELERYIEAKPDLRLGHAFIMGHNPVADEYAHEPESPSLHVAIMGLLARRLDDPLARSPERREEVDAFLPKTYDRIYNCIIEGLRFDIVDYLIRIGHLNGLFFLNRMAFSKDPKHKDFIRGFLPHLKAAAVGTDGPSPLLAALIATLERREMEGALPLEGLNEWTTIPYFFAVDTRFAVFDYLEATGKADAIDGLVRILDVDAVVGLWYEHKGRHAEAAASFAKGNRWHLALRAAQAAGDRLIEARALERTGNREAALEIWKALQRPRDVERVAKAIAKQSEKAAAAKAGDSDKAKKARQGELF